ncbi:MAG: hypothetical protein IVW57_16250, partial [Ktedonobacterales bacterium]|nr:hypothetical protein [Ktedonobacterales bacterium]
LNLISLVLLGTGVLTAGAYLYRSGVIVGAGLLPSAWRAGGHMAPAALAEAGLCVILGGYLIARGLGGLGRVRGAAGCFFLVTHSGFAEIQGERTRGAQFTEVRRITYGGGGLSGARIRVHLRSGKRLTYNLGRAYGPPRDIYAYLLAAYNALSVQRYRASTRPAPQS